jgi:predicted XRE-type DNA-binding protein
MKTLGHITGSGNVFKDLGFAGEEAENLKIRSLLMMEIDRFVEKSGLTQTEAAKRFGVTQPRMNDLLRGRINKFSIDMLINMLAAAGMKVTVKVRQAA